MKKILLLLLFLDFIPTFAFITRSDQLRSILDYTPCTHNKEIKKGILIICDIDNTLADQKGELGTEQWYEYVVKEGERIGFSHQQAVETALSLYYFIQEHTDLKAIEPDTSSFIAQLQDEYHVIALTSRGFTIASRTIDQLNALGINFARSSFFKNYNSTLYQCKEGIIFCQGRSKGKTLYDVFKDVHYFPHTVIFIDDTIECLQGAQAVLCHHCINFYGINYLGADKRRNSFNPRRADKELEQFYHTYKDAPHIPQLQEIYSKAFYMPLR